MTLGRAFAPLALIFAGCQSTPPVGDESNDGVADETSETSAGPTDESTGGSAGDGPADDSGDGPSEESTADSTDDTGQAFNDLPEEPPGDPCDPQDAESISDLCEGETNQFMWTGSKCVELCDACVGSDCDELDGSAEDCFAKRAHCIDPTQCVLEPVGPILVEGDVGGGSISADTGVFTGQQLFLGTSPNKLGGYLFTDFAAFEPYYPSVIIIDSPAWTMGQQAITAYAVGSFESANGQLIIDTVQLDGDPELWRMYGQITIDDPPHALNGLFEVAGCVPP